MSSDPIIDEVHEIRDTIAREYDYDLEAIFRMLQEAESKSGRRHVSPPPPQVTAVATAAAHRGADAGDGRRSK
jgi:hypothetical protein